MHLLKRLAATAFVGVVGYITTLPVQAQTTSGVATSTIIESGDPQNGSLICEDDLGFQLCDLEYNPRIFGVVVLSPEVAFISNGNPKIKPVMSAGVAKARVSSINGPIAEGDYITSSGTPGVGQKALKSGYVLGVAQGSWDNADPSVVGEITVSLQPKPAIMTSRAGSNLIQMIKDGIDATYLSPVMTLRYLLAALITVSSIVLAFWFFARVAHSGVQAIGRNPLAGKTIQMGILLNVLITLGVMGVGLFVAYLLLVF